MAISPGDFPRGASSPRTPQKIMQELLTLRHNGKNSETKELIIESFAEMVRREADYIEKDLGYHDIPLLEGATLAKKKELLVKARNRNAKYFCVEEPAALVEAMREFADLLQKGEANPDLLAEKERVAKGISDALLPLLYYRQSMLAEFEEDLNRGEDNSEIGIIKSIISIDPKFVPAEEQYVSFLKHAGALLLEWCDHPDIKARVPDEVRNKLSGGAWAQDAS